VPSKKTEAIIYQAKEVSLHSRLMGEFRAAKGLKARTNVAQEILKSYSDLSDGPAIAKEVITTLNTEILTHQRTQPSIALEAIFVRDEFAERPERNRARVNCRRRPFWQQELGRIGSVLEPMPAAKHRRALQSFKESSGDPLGDPLLLPRLITFPPNWPAKWGPCVDCRRQTGFVERNAGPPD